MRSSQQKAKASQKKAIKNTQRKKNCSGKKIVLTKKQKERKMIETVTAMAKAGDVSSVQLLAAASAKAKGVKSGELKTKQLIELVDENIQQLIISHALVEGIAECLDEGVIEDPDNSISDKVKECDELTVRWMEDANAVIALSHTELIPEDYVDMAISFMASTIGIMSDSYPRLIELTEDMKSVINKKMAEIIDAVKADYPDATEFEQVSKIHQKRMMKIMPLYGTPAPVEETETV